MNAVKARELAAQCWCDPKTAQIEMNPDLAEVVAQAIERAYFHTNHTGGITHETHIPHPRARTHD